MDNVYVIVEQVSGRVVAALECHEEAKDTTDELNSIWGGTPSKEYKMYSVDFYEKGAD